MAKNTTIRKFKKNDFSSDFSYEKSERNETRKSGLKKKLRSPNLNKSFDHLYYEE